MKHTAFTLICSKTVLILIAKPTRCTNFSNLFFGIKLYMFRTVPLSVIRSFFHCTHSIGICLTCLLTACEQDQDGTKIRPDPDSKNKFEKLVHLVGFIIRKMSLVFVLLLSWWKKITFMYNWSRFWIPYVPIGWNVNVNGAMMELKSTSENQIL